MDPLVFDQLPSKLLKKGTIIQREGDRKVKAYLVKKGLLRSYIISPKGKEYTFLFAPKGWIVSDPEAIFGQNSTQLFVDVLEDSEVAVLETNLGTVEGLDTDFYRRELERAFKRMSVLQRRVLMLMSESALLRYQHFVETYPNIVERVPQRMIASYLGITPEALSKVRASRMKKG